MRGDLVKRALADSLKQLLEKYSMDDITVNDIVDRAGISRTTFYRHFKDKYELINWVFGQYMEELEKKHSGNPDYDFRELVSEMLDFFMENRNFFVKIMYYTGQNNFYNYFFQSTLDYMEKCLRHYLDSEKLSDSDICMLHYHTGGILRIAYEWIEYDFHMSKEEIMDVLFDISSGRHRLYSLPFFRNV
ncbi:MAG: TetR/AcrR family transcriptional regulator C-terminal domain-containing protein [Oscillospiraceae bacterium]|nr:TetR/AcrR family transcriptional regulator C-terminal domain-containing protein [Oscillospiraceae bacterium]